MKCKHCGYENKNSAKFCKQCGNALEGQENKEKKTNKRSGKLILVLAAVLIACAAAAAIYALNHNSQEEVRLVNAESGEYLVFNAAKNFKLKITGSEKALKTYKVLDSNGKTTKASHDIKDGTLTIAAPEGGYTPGASYSIAINKDSKFLNEGLGKAKILTFIIYEKEICEVVFADQIINLDPSEMSKEGQTLLTKDSYEKGQILYLDETKKEPAQAYKVAGVQKDGDWYRIAYETPKIDELYKKININETLISDADYLAVDKGVVLEASNAMGILDAFTDDAQALSIKDIDCKVTDQGKDGLGIAITIKDPKHKGKTLELKFSVYYKTKINLKLNQQFIDNQLRFSSGITVSVKGSKKDTIKKQVEAAIEKFTKKNDTSFNTEKTKSKTFLDIFTVRVPLAGTINFYGKTGLKYQFDAGGELHFEFNSEISITQGVLVDNGKLKKKYANVSPGLGGELIAKGSVNTFLGLGGEFGVEVLPGSAIGFEVVPGIYGDMLGQFIIEDITKPSDSKGYYNVEAGIKTGVDLAVKLNYIVDQYHYNKNLCAFKKAFIKSGNTDQVESVNLKKHYSMQDNKVALGTLTATYKNILTKKTEDKEISKYTFYVDNKKVSVKKGLIQNKISEGNHTFKVTWKYSGTERNFEKKAEVSKHYEFGVYTDQTIDKTYVTDWEWEGQANYPVPVKAKIPKISSDTKNYAEINGQIDAFNSDGYGLEIYTLVSKFNQGDYSDVKKSQITFVDYSYSVYHSNETTALIIENNVGWGFHGSTDFKCIYYDNSTGNLLSEKEYVELNGYSIDQVKAEEKIQEEEHLSNVAVYFEDGNLRFKAGLYAG